jgi:NitT/TauT family transport system permease protein
MRSIKTAHRYSLFDLRTEISPVVYATSGAALILVIFWGWWLVTSLGWVSPIFLPSPLAVANELMRQLQEGLLWVDVRASVYRITLGWLISTAVALPIGILMGNFRFFEGLLEPLIDLVRYMPAVAFVPLTILWMGVGDQQKIVILFIGTFFQQVLLVMDNVKNVPFELIQVSYTFGLSKREVLWDVVMKSALPALWDTTQAEALIRAAEAKTGLRPWRRTDLLRERIAPGRLNARRARPRRLIWWWSELVAANVGLGYRIMRWGYL